MLKLNKKKKSLNSLNHLTNYLLIFHESPTNNVPLMTSDLLNDLSKFDNLICPIAVISSVEVKINLKHFSSNDPNLIGHIVQWIKTLEQI